MNRLDRGRQLVHDGRAAGVELALLGGAAVALRCESARTGPYSRELGDVDLAGRSRDRKRIVAFAREAGLRDDVAFNGANSDVRLRFLDDDDSHVDVFLDELRLCHTVTFRPTLAEGDTIPLPALFLTKTQVVELTPKDVSDLSALLTDEWHRLWGDREHLQNAVKNDWGLWRTTRGTLERLVAADDTFVATRAAELLHYWIAMPLGPRARLRAAVGDRVRWYEEPEEV